MKKAMPPGVLACFYSNLNRQTDLFLLRLQKSKNDSKVMLLVCLK